MTQSNSEPTFETGENQMATYFTATDGKDEHGNIKGASVALQHGYVNPIGEAYFPGQGELFSIKRPTIHSLFSTPGSEKHAATLLGMAHNLSIQQFGVAPVADREMSPDSHRLAKRMSHVPGVLGEEPIPAPTHPKQTAEYNQSAVNSNYDMTRYGRRYREVTPEEVQAGRATVRRVTRELLEKRNAEKPEPPSTFEHPRLPGM